MGRCSDLMQVQRQIDNGMPVSATRVAKALGVQFAPATLKRWLRDKEGNRYIYAWVVLGEEDSAVRDGS